MDFGPIANPRVRSYAINEFLTNLEVCNSCFVSAYKEQLNMRHRSNLLFASLLALSLLFIAATPTHAAAPGEELVNSSGVVSSAAAVNIPLYSASPANISLQLSGPAGASATLTLRDNVGNPLKSWVVESGETAWGFGDLPLRGKFTLQTASSAGLSYALHVFARGAVPNIAGGSGTWSGTAHGGNPLQSAIQLDIPAAGLYQFALNAGSGKYQIKVDED